MFIVIKDPHFRFGMPRPVGRKESFEQEIDAKWDFVLEYANKHNIKHIVFTGDVFDVKAPSKYDFNHIRAIKRRFRKATSQGITISSTVGNHDLPMASIDNYEMSVFYDMVQDKYLQNLCEHPITIGEYNLVGVPYYRNQEDFHQAMSIVNECEGNNLVVLHEHIIPDEAYEGHINFIKYSQMVKTYPNIKGFICGHLHRGFPTQEYKKKLFVNPWSFTRLARNYYALNDEHTPMFTHIKDHLLYEDIIIPHSSFEEGFNAQEFDKAVELEMDLEGFKTSLDEFVTSGDTDLTKLGIPEEVRAKVEDYLARARG